MKASIWLKKLKGAEGNLKYHTGMISGQNGVVFSDESLDAGSGKVYVWRQSCQTFELQNIYEIRTSGSVILTVCAEIWKGGGALLYKVVGVTSRTYIELLEEASYETFECIIFKQYNALIHKVGIVMSWFCDNEIELSQSSFWVDLNPIDNLKIWREIFF